MTPHRTRSGVALTPLGLGTSQLGNLGRRTSDDEAASAVAAAFDAGIAYFDTAPHYGLGLAERRLGALLKNRPRERLTVSTKVGRLLVPNEGPAGPDDEGFAVPATVRRVWDFSADGVRRSLESSLERLGLGRIDVVYLHDPDQHWEQASREAIPALVKLRDEGVVGAIGAGMNQSAMLAEFVRRCDVDIVMCAGRYTLLDRSAERDLLPAALERGVTVVAAGVYNSGLLAAGRPRAGATYDYSEAGADLIARTHRLADVCESHGVSLPQAALAFPLRHPAVAGVVVGCRNAAQVRSAVDRYETAVPDSLWEELAAEVPSPEPRTQERP